MSEQIPTAEAAPKPKRHLYMVIQNGTLKTEGLRVNKVIGEGSAWRTVVERVFGTASKFVSHGPVEDLPYPFGSKAVRVYERDRGPNTDREHVSIAIIVDMGEVP